MAEHTFPCWAVFQILENRFALAEVLGFPEVARLGMNKTRLAEHLRRNLLPLVEALPPSELYRHQIGGVPFASTVSLSLEPPHGSILWRRPLSLTFPVVRWSHASEAEVAFVPALGIAVVASTASRLEELLADELQMGLARMDKLTLRRLVECQRAPHLVVESLPVAVNLRSPKMRALAAEREREQAPSVLAAVATDLTRLPSEPTYGLEQLIEQLAELLAARSPRSVLLVGPSGVGKTALVHELVRQRSARNLGDTPFWATSGARLVAGMSGYGMWQERCQRVVREAARKHAILHLGNLIELMEVGKSEYNALGIAAFLRPYLARGELLAIAECTPEQIPLIEREDPHLLAVLHTLTVPEPNVERGRTILNQVAACRGKPLPAETLDTLDRLHRRYATYSAYPGRPLRFLNNLLHDLHAAPTIVPADVLAAFTRETGLPRVLLDPAEPLDLIGVRTWFEERVLGQPEAVELVVDLLATTKAGLTRPRRPIASLLFIGPTGVGKTEMAKALAEFLFGSRLRLTRFDMSEFNDPVSAQRLVGGVFGSEGLLTARVREQPFSVLLLDEFEKADPLVFDLLLQILGEGRLTDAAGRLADFCNTVVVLTSNLGAESYQQGPFGFSAAGTEKSVEASTARQQFARAHFTRAVEEFLRPELFNRIDRIVPFAPLNASTIMDIALRHLQRLERRDGIRYRSVTLQLGDGVAGQLARNGFDPRYGARPLLRTVERELLAPVAEGMNRHGAETPLTVDVRLEGAALRVAVKPRIDRAGRPLTTSAAVLRVVEAAQQTIELRRQIQALDRSPSVREFRNELFQLEKEQERFEKARRRLAARIARLAQAPEAQRRFQEQEGRVRRDQARVARLARLREIAKRLGNLQDQIYSVEAEALHALYADAGEATFAREEVVEALRPLRQEWHQLLLTFYRRQFREPDRMTLALFSEDPVWLKGLASAYRGVAQALGIKIELVAYHLPSAIAVARDTPVEKPAEPQVEQDGDETLPQFWRQDTLVVAASRRQPEREILTRKRIADPDAFFASAWQRVPGLVLGLRGAAAALRFTPEAGLHIFRGPRQAQASPCLVEVSESEPTAYLPPLGITRRGAIGSQNRRRTYDRIQDVLDDVLLQEKLPWQNRPLAIVLAGAIEKRLQRNLLALVQE
jgi:ATP-dependent Clp protease ATP-binding subunit ClpC